MQQFRSKDLQNSEYYHIVALKNWFRILNIGQYLAPNHKELRCNRGQWPRKQNESNKWDNPQTISQD